MHAGLITRLVWLGTLLTACAASASAQEHDNQPTVVVILEADGGLQAAADLRQALNAAGYDVRAPLEAHRQRDPDAYIAVASDLTGAISVRYWDRQGRTDSLTAEAPATATPDQRTAITQALTQALINRHRSTPQPLYATLHPPRTNIQLHVEDF